MQHYITDNGFSKVSQVTPLGITCSLGFGKNCLRKKRTAIGEAYNTIPFVARAG